MPHFCNAVFDAGENTDMGPVCVIVVVIPDDDVTRLCIYALEIRDPLLIGKALDIFPLGTSWLYELVNVIVVKPCNGSAAGSVDLIFVDIAVAFLMLFLAVELAAVLELLGLVLVVFLEFVNSAECKPEYKAYITVTGKAVLLVA